VLGCVWKWPWVFRLSGSCRNISSKLRSYWVGGNTTESSLNHLVELDCKEGGQDTGVLNLEEIVFQLLKGNYK